MKDVKWPKRPYFFGKKANPEDKKIWELAISQKEEWKRMLCIAYIQNQKKKTK